MTRKGPLERLAGLRDRRAIVRRRRGATWQIVVALLVATIGAAGLGYLAVQLFYLPETMAQARTARVPDLSGMDDEEAVARGESDGYVVVRAGSRHSPEVEAGEVLYQIPPPGFYLPAGDTLRILVSRGPARPTMPDLAGLEPALAESILHQLGLELTPPRRVQSDLHLQGTVVETVPPPGTQVARGTSVTLVLSRGGSMLAMPDVRGLALAEARDTLEMYSLTVGEVSEVAGTPGAGEGVVVVTAQEPGPGRNVRAGSAVRLQLGERVGAAPAAPGPPPERPPPERPPPDEDTVF